MSSLSNPTDSSSPKRLTSVGAFGAGSLVALVTAANASANIIVFDDSLDSFSGNVTNGADAPWNGDWNVDGSGGREFRFSFNNPITASSPAYMLLAPNGAGNGIATGAGGKLLALSNGPGQMVGTNLNFKSTNSISSLLYSYAQNSISLYFKNATGFTFGNTSYLGFQFNPSGSLTLYGWAEVTFTADNQGSITVHRWAYDDSGAAIQVGAVPEPAAAATGLGLLALGAAGLRRKRWLKRNRG